MTAALLFVPMSPPGATPARPTQGEGSTDVAGLFALLLAGAQPAQANVAAGAQPTSRPALAPALTGAVAPGVAPTPKPQKPVPLDPSVVGPTAATPLPEAALPLPAATAVAGQAGIGEGDPLPQLGPPTREVPSQEAAAAQGAERTRTAPAAHPLLDARLGAIRPAPGDAVAPLRPAITAGQTLLTPMSDAAQTLQAAPKREVQIASTADAQLSIARDGWSPQTTAPRRITGAPAVAPRVPSPSTTAGRATGTPAPELARPNVSMFATTSAAPGPAAEQLAVNDQGGLESTFEAFETVLGRSEQSAADPMRPPPPGRAAPAPIFQIGVQIAKAAPARIDRLFVQLEPAALGRVEVRLEFHRDNQVSAMIAAERPDTLDALQRDARLLERSLHDAGLRLDSDGLTFSLKREQTQDQAGEHAPFALPANDVDDQPHLTTHGDEPPPLHWFHGLRTLDIRI